MNKNDKIEIQSATFERLLKHLDERKDVQNIDLMNLANFCRNCLSRWYREVAEKKGIIFLLILEIIQQNYKVCGLYQADVSIFLPTHQLHLLKNLVTQKYIFH